MVSKRMRSIYQAGTYAVDVLCRVARAVVVDAFRIAAGWAYVVSASWGRCGRPRQASGSPCHEPSIQARPIDTT